MPTAARCLIVLAFAVSARAAEPTTVPVRESWDAAYLEGQKVGYQHTTVSEFTRDGQTLRRVTRELRLTVRRGSATSVLDVVDGDEETADGKVVGVFVQYDKGRELAVTGRLDGGVMVITVRPGGKEPYQRRLPWDDEVIGLNAEEGVPKDRQVKPGDHFAYRIYSPTITNVARTDVAVKEWETVRVAGKPRRLLRVESRPEKVNGFQLPAKTLWLDEQWNIVQSQIVQPTLGELTLVRATKAEANRASDRVPDLFAIQAIVLNRSIPRPLQTNSVTYRVTLAPPLEDLDKLFAVGDGRQEVLSLKPSGLELRVTAKREPGKTGDVTDVADEYTKSNLYITSDDAVVRKYARSAVGTETDPWKKAQRITGWVKSNMHPLKFDNGINPADQAARSLEGDCTEFAMLAAAMCRAEGVPSRTAIGLAYKDDFGTPKLNYHMWLEVCVQGQWIALDPTLGLNAVGATHLKITDHSWHDVRSMTPLLPVMRFMTARPKIEVVN
ncbi:MAG: transglutaminase family protein [Gemmataceae bacterium]